MRVFSEWLSAKAKPCCIGRVFLQSISHTKRKEAILDIEGFLSVYYMSSDLHDVHAGLSELVGELLPDEEVKQLSRLAHHHLAVRHIVQSLNKFLKILNHIDHYKSAEYTSS